METPRLSLVTMTASRISFLLFMLMCCGIFCALGTWQVKRLHWKENLISQIDQAYAIGAQNNPIEASEITSFKPDHFLRGRFFGRFRFDESFYLMGQIDEGKQTKHLMVPLIIEPDVTILVDMGADFLPKGNPKPTARITGLLKHAAKTNSFTPENIPAQKIWYSINPGQLKIDNLLPLIIKPEITPWKNFEAQKPELRNSHLQYAIFWFTMAGLIFLLTLFYIRKR